MFVNTVDCVILIVSVQTITNTISDTTSSELRFDFFGAIRSHATERPDAVALESLAPQGKESFTWSRLDREIHSVAQYLQAQGVRPGDRVAILLENHPRWGVAFAATQSAGAIAVPLDTLADAVSILAVVRHSQACFLIASPQLSEIAGKIQAEIAGIGTLAREADWSSAVGFGAGSLGLPLVRRSLDDALVILYTGGTTGKPKGVLLTQRNLYRSITDMLEVFPLSSADRILSVLPLFHVMPLLANLLAPLYAGSRVVFLTQLDPQSLMRAFSSEGITAFLCVPQFYYQIQRRILEEVKRQRAVKQRIFFALLKLSGYLRRKWGWRVGTVLFGAVHARFGGKLRAFGIGGAYFNPKAAEFFADLGFPLFQAYGLTECSGLASVTRLDRDGGMSCGQAVAHCELRLANADKSGIGEILIRGENVMQGYWREPDATSQVIRDGWLYSGDLGTLDARGFLRLTGRAKDVIVLSSGKNVFPEELEEYFLRQCSSLQEVCLVGVERSDGATLHCVAVPAAGAMEADLRREIASASRGLASYKRPGSLQVTTQPLPRTTTRKLQRFKIRDMAAADTPWGQAQNSTAQPSGAMESEIAALVRRIRSVNGTFGRHTNFGLDLHLDSLERVELFANVEKRFGIRFTAETAAGIHDVGNLMDAVGLAQGQASGGEEWSDWPSLVRQALTPEEQAYADIYLRRRPFLENGLFAAGRVLALALNCVMGLRIRRNGEFPSPPFLICPNHLSYLDDLVVASSFTRPIFRRMFAVAASKYFRGPLVNWLISLFRVLPIDGDRNLLKGLRMAKAGLEKGLVFCIFPEGTRSYDGYPRELQKGAAILACALQLPVVPMGIAGTFEAWPRGKRFPRPGRIALSVGEALMPAASETAGAFNERLAKALGREVQAAKDLRNS